MTHGHMVCLQQLYFEATVSAVEDEEVQDHRGLNVPETGVSA